MKYQGKVLGTGVHWFKKKIHSSKIKKNKETSTTSFFIDEKF